MSVIEVVVGITTGMAAGAIVEDTAGVIVEAIVVVTVAEGAALTVAAIGLNTVAVIAVSTVAAIGLNTVAVIAVSTVVENTQLNITVGTMDIATDTAMADIATIMVATGTRSLGGWVWPLIPTMTITTTTTMHR